MVATVRMGMGPTMLIFASSKTTSVIRSIKARRGPFIQTTSPPKSFFSSSGSRARKRASNSSPEMSSASPRVL